MKKSYIVILLAGFLLSAVGFGFMQIFASEKEEELVIEKDRAKQLDVKMEFGAGEFTLSGGSKEWITGSANYNHRKLKPKIEYKQKNDRGVVKVVQNEGINFGFNNFRNLHNSWDLQLTDEIPVNLDVDLGATEALLDLRGVQLHSLNIDSGVGDSTLDLSGEPKNSYKAKIDMGVGDLTIYVPESYGVKVSAEKGLGQVNVPNLISQGNGIYVNEAYNGKDFIELTIDMGVGNVDVLMK
ncbi:toast rack family protein [Chungangia koreensis]|uniref:Toast rack family protein n=1 Tax=Chungangia koreensis TaxID=752657 RepID=A0ABV8X4U7_9LACT